MRRRELQGQFGDRYAVGLAELLRLLKVHTVRIFNGMPSRRFSAGEESAAKRTRINQSNPLLSRFGKQFQRARVIEAIVIVHQHGIYLELIGNPVPEVHRIYAETHASDSPGLLEVLERCIRFFHCPFHVHTAAVLDIVDNPKIGEVAPIVREKLQNVANSLTS